MFSFLGDYDYEFPEPVKLEKRLKDVLEDKVDEKFYLNNEKAKKLIEDLIVRGEIPTHNRTLSIKKKELVYLNANRIEKINCEVVKTLCARDYKGYGTGWDTMNGVIEKE